MLKSRFLSLISVALCPRNLWPPLQIDIVHSGFRINLDEMIQILIALYSERNIPLISVSSRIPPCSCQDLKTLLQILTVPYNILT